MSRLVLSLAVGAYDHVRDVCTGDVPVDGIDLVAMHRPIEDVLYRTHNHSEWHIAELGMGGYVARLARGEQPYVAIPVFTSRVFRHSCIYVNADSGIRSPADLNGRRIGMPEWGMAAAVWARGMLSDRHGFDQHSAHWVQGGLQEPGRVDRSPPLAGLGIDYTNIRDRCLDEMLVAGDIDALFSARVPPSFNGGKGAIRRLFGNLQQEELAYWEASRVFPIMHLLGIRRDIYEQHPWVARALYDAFDESKNRSLDRARDTSSSYFPVPLMLHAVSTARAVAGDDFWPYGIERNAETLETFLRYAHTQGLIERPLDVRELFAPEVRFTTRT